MTRSVKPEGLRQLYKVCEGCDGLVAKKWNVCPSCHAYKFSDTIERIREAMAKAADGTTPESL